MSSLSGIGQIPAVTLCAGSVSMHLTSSAPVSTPQPVVFVSEKPATIGGDGRENGQDYRPNGLRHIDVFQGLAEGF